MEGNGMGLTTGSVAKQGVGEAKRLGSTARRRIYSYVDEKKESVVGKAEGWIDKIGKLADGTVGESSAKGVKGLAEKVKSRSTEELIGDLQSQARARPGVFMLGALVLGFLGARLLRDVGSQA